MLRNSLLLILFLSVSAFAQNVSVLTTTGTQTITHKTINGASNTLSNIPASATTGTAATLANTPQASSNTITLPNGTTITANNATSLLGKPIVDAVADGKFLKYDATVHSGTGGWVMVSGTSGNPFDQELDTTDAVNFASVNGIATALNGSTVRIGGTDAEASTWAGVQIGSRIIIQSVIGSQFAALENANNTGAAWKYIANGSAKAFRFTDDSGAATFSVHLAPTGSAGDDIADFDTAGVCKFLQISASGGGAMDFYGVGGVTLDGGAITTDGAGNLTVASLTGDVGFSNITNLPSTVSGYGITNAISITGTAAAALNFGIVATGLSATQTVAVAGASIGDGVILGRPADGGQGLQKAWVSASGTVSIVSFAEIALTSTSQTYYFTTTKHP